MNEITNTSVRNANPIDMNKLENDDLPRSMTHSFCSKRDGEKHNSLSSLSTKKLENVPYDYFLLNHDSNQVFANPFQSVTNFNLSSKPPSGQAKVTCTGTKHSYQDSVNITNQSKKDRKRSIWHYQDIPSVQDNASTVINPNYASISDNVDPSLHQRRNAATNISGRRKSISLGSLPRTINIFLADDKNIKVGKSFLIDLLIKMFSYSINDIFIPNQIKLKKSIITSTQIIHIHI